MTQDKKKILLISYHFPPSTAIGGMRIASFAKYLPAHGWNPYVLTLKDHYLQHKDRGRLDSLEGISIIKAGKTITLRDIYLRIKLLLNSLKKGGKQVAKPIVKNKGKTIVEKKSKKGKFKLSTRRNWA